MLIWKRLVLFAVVFLTLGIPISAQNPSYIQGEVIYHQDFSVLSDFALSGIAKGTSSSDLTRFSCVNGAFHIETYDGGRAYAILPDSDWTRNFTVEFTFSFAENTAANGYLAVILTSSGDEPTNISQINIRAKGTVDDFESPSTEMIRQIRAGETVTVRVPVENGVIQQLTLSSGEITEELQRTSLMLIGSGNRGFSVRNANVDISEIYIVNGTEYTNKIGYWAEHSYAEDGGTQSSPAEGTETAPETGDAFTAAMILTAIGTFAAAKRMNKRNKR